MFEKHPGPSAFSATAPGDSLWFFGQEVLLQITGSSSLPFFENGILVAGRIDGIAKWLDEQLLEKVRFFVAMVSGETGLVPQRIRLGNARTRWGSCSVGGVVMINRKLVHAPLHVVEYIVAHEVLHLRHRNHGRLFRADLADLVRDVPGAKKWLRLQGAHLL
jgi:predicted metal-dependent hydrolase